MRQLVTALEQTVVKTLAEYGIESYPKPDAPGVYVDGKRFVLLDYVFVVVALFTGWH